MSEAAAGIALIGFGEAGMAFAGALRGRVALKAFDIKTLDPAAAAAKWEDYRRLGVSGAASLGQALAGADLVLSLVTADQALVATRQAAQSLPDGALYCDFNSAAPATKGEAAALIEGAGGHYADVAVMAPVHPRLLSVPLLVSGPTVAEACARLTAIGFAPRAAGEQVGRASMIKMLRSVMVKGMEALTAECFLACWRAGVVDEVASSLGETWPGVDWVAKADYNLERMMVHGDRRAAEMDEVARTLADLGMASDMARATAAAQRRIGAMALKAAPGLDAKAQTILDSKPEAA